MIDLEDMANINVTFSFSNGETINMPFIVAWSIYHSPGYRPVFEIAMLGAQIAKPDINTDPSLRQQIEEEARKVTIMVFTGLKQKHPTREDLLCFFSYQLLSQGLANRPEVAQLVSYLLGRTIETDTWRKRLDKYIEAHGLAALKLVQGRKTNKPGK